MNPNTGLGLLGKRKERDFIEEEKKETGKKNQDQVGISIQDRQPPSLFHLNDLRNTSSQVYLPPGNECVYFLYLSADKLYTAVEKTLYVY